jgi:hypothetical protein
MHASIRRYTGVDPRFWDQIAQHRTNLEATFRRLPSFRSWYLVRTGDGLTTVTLCEDQAGAEESARVAATYIREIMADMIPNAPAVATGEVVERIGG